MRIRLLTPEDALSFRELRLRALKDHPDAFGSSYEEAANLSVEETAERLKSSPDALIWVPLMRRGSWWEWSAFTGRKA